MYFFILSPYKIEALEFNQADFMADDLLSAIESGETVIATTEQGFYLLREANPHLTYYYKIAVEKFAPVSSAAGRPISIAV